MWSIVEGIARGVGSLLATVPHGLPKRCLQTIEISDNPISGDWHSLVPPAQQSVPLRLLHLVSHRPEYVLVEKRIIPLARSWPGCHGEFILCAKCEVDLRHSIRAKHMSCDTILLLTATAHKAINGRVVACTPQRCERGLYAPCETLVECGPPMLASSGMLPAALGPNNINAAAW